MRSICTFSCFAITILLGHALGLSSTQEANPSGSYQQTCSDISVRKGSLYARCQDTKGKARSSKLSNYQRCSDITNTNGKLECAGDGEPSQPRGSYTDSCKNIQMKGTTLHAVCKSLDGREMPTTLKDANSCAEGVSNINGILNCEVSGILPPGSYIATCKDVRLLGTTLLASCNDGKDHWVNASLRDVNRCKGDIANQNGALRCTAIQREKR
jgi:CVNH domain